MTVPVNGKNQLTSRADPILDTDSGLLFHLS